MIDEPGLILSSCASDTALSLPGWGASRGGRDSQEPQAGERVFVRWKLRLRGSGLQPGLCGSSPIPEQHHQDYTELPVTGWQAVPGRCQPSASLPSFGITFLHEYLPGKLL